MFSDWLKFGFILIAKKPLFWLMYCVVLYPLLALGSLSQMLGIVLAVICLFVGVGAAAYSDSDFHLEKTTSLNAAIKQSLPLAIIAGLAVMVCWFLFKVVADMVSGEMSHIINFFWQWDLLNDEFWAQSRLTLFGKIYTVAMVTLMFTILMLTTFASWFSFPLMVFKNSRWSVAKKLGNQLSRDQKKAISNLMLFLGIAMVLGFSMMPFLTPQIYALTSILMYVSYRQIFASAL